MRLFVKHMGNLISHQFPEIVRLIWQIPKELITTHSILYRVLVSYETNLDFRDCEHFS
jgi:hypothetical protein